MDDHVTDFYQRHYDVDSMSMSAQRIVETAERQHEAAPHLPLVRGVFADGVGVRIPQDGTAARCHNKD